VRRADSLPPSRLLYDAKFKKGGVTAPGTLSVFVRSGSLTAKATGPLGGEMAHYENGTLTEKGGEAHWLDPGVLRAVLSGVWRDGPPAVVGAEGQQALLRWESAQGVAEGVLDVAGARLTRFSIRGRAGTLEAEFGGLCDPWPASVSLRDVKSGRSLKLRRVVTEPLED
jgi:hypothetical protein